MSLKYPMLPPIADSVDSFCVPSVTQHPASETLTSESAKPAEGLSRRLMLAALAALPAALPAAAVEPDPIYAAIETCRAALAAWMAALALQAQLEKKGEHFAAREVAEKPCHDANDAFEAFVSEPATTAPGLFAKVAYLRELMADFETSWIIPECVCPGELINSLAASLKNIGVLA